MSTSVSLEKNNQPSRWRTYITWTFVVHWVLFIGGIVLVDLEHHFLGIAAIILAYGVHSGDIRPSSLFRRGR